MLESKTIFELAFLVSYLIPTPYYQLSEHVMERPLLLASQVVRGDGNRGYFLVYHELSAYADNLGLIQITQIFYCTRSMCRF